MMTNHIAFYQFCSAVRRKGALALCLALCMLGLGLSGSAQDRKPTIITFDVPAASGIFPGYTGTMPQDINPEGVITGFYAVVTNTSSGLYGFVRDPDGHITTFVGPGLGQMPEGINSRGVIAGSYVTSTTGLGGTSSCQGFLRDPDGRITAEFDVRDAIESGPDGACGTVPLSINTAGVTSGYWVDDSYVYHGFVRATDGTITPFDAAPGAPFTLANNPNGINPAGTISGFWVDTGGVYHGFVRATDGTITSYDAPHAVGTVGFAINPAGAIAGSYGDKSGAEHGFVRDPDGKITEFNAPHAGKGSGQGTGTIGLGINSMGVIAGQYVDKDGVYHGFVRDPDGKITEFDVTTPTPPDPLPGTSLGQGTIPFTINDAGEITGWYIDADGVNHGFLLIP
jgi:hypothetical protein